MLRYLFSAIVLLLVGCGAASQDPPHSIDENLNPIYNETIIQINNYCMAYKHVPPYFEIRLNDLARPYVGFCSTYDDNHFVIDIDRLYWYTSNEHQKYALFMHEMSHCFILAKHSTDPNNYMYPVLPVTTKELVIEQLKNLCK